MLPQSSYLRASICVLMVIAAVFVTALIAASVVIGLAQTGIMTPRFSVRTSALACGTFAAVACATAVLPLPIRLWMRIGTAMLVGLEGFLMSVLVLEQLLRLADRAGFL